jgi:hypothetical protein
MGEEAVVAHGGFLGMAATDIMMEILHFLPSNLKSGL